MTTYKLFVASSMKNPFREIINTTITSINTILDEVGISVKFELKMYSNTPIDDRKRDTQNDLNKIAMASDLFILLADNNTCIGKYTIEEYEAAHNHAITAKNETPFIKTFVITTSSKETIKLTYKKNDDSIENFEKRLHDDSKRYLQSINSSNFLSFFEEWLIKIAKTGISNNLLQTELSYENLLNKNGQSKVRRFNNKYYRRECLDGKIDNILEQSPIIILEGSTYSGKSRAAFEVMKNKTEWNKREFHIYCNANSLESLNQIRLNISPNNNGDIYLFDDINDIIRDNKITYENSLWAQLKDCFNNSNLGNNHIIITVSGKLPRNQKMALYKKIFHVTDVGAKFEEFLNSIIVDFDIYDKYSFKNMVDEMRRKGEIIGSIEQGNFTIGSLFINDADLMTKANHLYSHADDFGHDLKIILRTLVCHYKYAQNGPYMGSIDEIRCLYTFLYGKCDKVLLFEKDIEELRQSGLLYHNTSTRTISIDKFVLNKFNNVVIADETFDILSNCIDYAKENSNSNSKYIQSISHMGYLLCKRNKLEDYELIKLIDLVTKSILGFKYNDKITKETPQRIANLVEISKNSEAYYNLSFCETIIARIENFSTAKDFIDTCFRYYNKKGPETSKTIYKRIVYAMFSKNNREMTMEEERTILAYILNDDKTWKLPFCKDDLKNIFILNRISPFLRLTSTDIINYISQSTLDGCNLLQYENNDDESIEDEFSEIDTPHIEFDYYNKVFIPRIGETIMTAFSKISSFKEFNSLKEEIEQKLPESQHLKDAAIRITLKFYKFAPTIAKRLTFEDRMQLFNFIFNKNSDSISIFGNIQLDLDYDFKNSRITALNLLLELLDGDDALASCNNMLKSEKHDKKTLSYLLKNEFLQFEQLFPLIEQYPAHKNFITLNQLMNKAETKTDALSCMRSMGLRDDNAANLKDERALMQYIDINTVTRNKATALIRDWHKIHKGLTISDNGLMSFMKKLDYKDLITILYPNNSSINYMDLYGLDQNEVILMRNNAAFYNLLFLRANEREEYKDSISEIYSKLKETDLQPLIINPNYNKNNSILSVYLKNKWLFPSCKNIMEEVNQLSKQSNIWRKDENIYSPILWWISKNNDLEQLNNVLIEAFNYFAKYNTSIEVERKMSTLYHYIPRCVDEKTINQSIKIQIAYEGNIIIWDDFKSYLEYIRDNKPHYIDGKFIYLTLLKMTTDINNNVYNCLKDIAKCNRKGVNFNSISKLPKPVIQRLFNVDQNRGEITIDSDFIINIPRIKMLWYILKNKLLSIEQVENYRIQNNITITQTYFNMMFKAIEEYNNDNAFNDMIALLPDNNNQNQSFNRSVQMCISFINIAPNEEELVNIFNSYGFNDFHNRTEVIGARINRLLNLRRRIKEPYNYIEKFKTEITNNNTNINISIINLYLYTLLMIRLGDIQDPQLNSEDAKKILDSCWSEIEVHNENPKRINVTKLLNDYNSCTNNTEWVLEVNAQTISYFAEQCNNQGQSIVRKIYEWFDGNFFYDEEMKKSCLVDAIKNYSRITYTEIGHDLNEVNFIVNTILLSDKNNNAMQLLCNNYVVNEKANTLRRKIYPFWQDALTCQEFFRYLTNKGVSFIM